MSSKLFAVILVVLLYSNYNLINAEDSRGSTLDLSCANDEDCNSYFKTAEINSSCYKHECKCFDKRNTTVNCKPVIRDVKNFIGDPCPCAVENSSCHPRNNTCICNNNYTSSVNRRHCVAIEPNNTAGGECDNDSFCKERDENTKCDVEKKMCICPANFTMSDKKCVPNNTTVSECQDDSFCMEQDGNSRCDVKTKACVCLANFTMSEKRCIPKNTTVGECDDDSFCISRVVNSHCDENTKMCVCSANSVWSDNECVPVVDSNHLCENDDDCKALRNRTVCIKETKKCKCQNDYSLDNETSECLLISTVGHICSDSSDCRMASGLAICVNGTCECDPSYYKQQVKGKGIRCIKKIFVGDNCTTKWDCFEANRHHQVMDCADGKCVCLPKYVATNQNRCESSSTSIFGTHLKYLIILSNLLFIYGITKFLYN